MGRMIDIDALFDYFGNDAINETTRSNIEYFISEEGTVEAIPKADYENRLKADMMAMLEDLDLRLEEMENPFSTRISGCSKDGWEHGVKNSRFLIKEEINALRGETK